MEIVRIPGRFNGPPDSGNGGYLGGLLAPEGAVTRVVLRSPSPLETPLRWSAGRLYDGDTLLAEVSEGAFQRPTPPPVAEDQATIASKRFPGTGGSPFDGCFVCGTSCEDGLRIAPGEVEPGLVAAPWTPDHSPSLTPALLWAVMDCPGGWALPGFLGSPGLLGTMTATIHALPEPGERCVVVGRADGDQGRKSLAATAVYGEDGRLLGRAEEIWIRFAR
jgi:hypothetical protein